METVKECTINLEHTGKIGKHEFVFVHLILINVAQKDQTGRCCSAIRADSKLTIFQVALKRRTHFRGIGKLCCLDFINRHKVVS